MHPQLSQRFTFILFALVAVYIAQGWMLAAVYDATGQFSVLMYSRPVVTTTLLLAVLFFSGVIIKIMVMDRPKYLTLTIVDEMKTRWITRERVMQGLPVIFAFLFFMAAFTSLKTLIPIVQPYAWDEYFAQLDRVIHFGTDPWRYLQPLLGFPLITFIINVVYNLWFPVMFGVLYWQAFTLKRPALRQRYFLSFFLCWIINGTILAMVFSSVGPCFYGKLYPGVTAFTPLMDYLHKAHEVYPIWAVTTQDMLWSVYQDGGLSTGAGISAMPSLHVSIAFLQMLLAYAVNRRLGHVFAVFFAFIMVGSVHLGWHYAVDGYLSIVTTFIIWWGMGRITRENN